MEAINKLNPWWFFKDWDRYDKNLSEWENQKVKWIPEWINDVSLKPSSLNFIYGPRQTGKTTGVKLLIKKLIEEERKDPSTLFYLDLDYVTSLIEFRRILEELLKEKERRGKDKSYLIVLDEVSSIEEWYRILKYFIDLGEFRKDVIVVTGSSSLGMEKIPERFPGRRGEGKDVIVLPLSFQQYVKVLGYKKEELIYNKNLALALFEDYLNVGGFPKSINKNPDAKDSIINFILSEIYKAKKSPRIAQDIFYSLLSKLPSAISYNSIANDIGVSHNTVREYLEFLSDIYLLNFAYIKVDDKVYKNKEKKVFFRDPFLLRVIADWVHGKFDESALLENVVQEHLYRVCGEVYYFKNSYEIDIITRKYRLEIKSKRSHKSYPKGVEVLTKEKIPEFLLGISETL